MAKRKKKSELSTTQKIEIGFGLTAAAVAAAGAYFLYGSKDAAQNRQKVKSWALKAKAEVLEKLEDAKQMSREEYQELVHKAADAYATAKTATKADVSRFKKEMMEYWAEIEKTAKPIVKDAAVEVTATAAAEIARKGVKKGTKTAVKAKKTAKKAAKKASKTAKKSAKKTTS